MKIRLILSALSCLVCAGTLQAAEPAKQSAHSIIQKKCTSCHSREKIDVALSSGKDMAAIQKEMEKRGAKLNINEREVLGIYWKQAAPLKK